MLEKLETGNKLSKSAYRGRLPLLQARLFATQRACWESGLGALVVVEGWGGAGKGQAVTKLTEKLEPRAFEIHTIGAPRTHETYLPWLYRFWSRLPSYGKLAIFLHSWYRRVLRERFENSSDGDETHRAFDDINAFERALSDDRYTIVKFFLHIDQREQKKRLKKLEKDPATAWRVQPHDWEQNARHQEYVVAIEEMLAHSETEWAPWTIVDARDRRWARIRVIETLIDRLERQLESRIGLRRESLAHGARARFEPIGDSDGHDHAADDHE